MKSSFDLLRLAVTAADRAADYLRGVKRPRDPSEWTVKGRNDFVTECDRRSEEIIAETLLAGEPDSTVIGEELSPDGARSGLVWIVDPIDGTTNFLHGFPNYSISIAAEDDGILQAAVVLGVETNQRYGAHRGGGATVNDQPIRVSSIGDPSTALIGTGFPFKHPEHLHEYLGQFAKINAATAGIRRAGSAALDLAWVASGVFDGFWELFLHPWDMAAGILLIREAGGMVTDVKGNEARPRPGPLVASNGRLHPWLLATLER